MSSDGGDPSIGNGGHAKDGLDVPAPGGKASRQAGDGSTGADDKSSGADEPEPVDLDSVRDRAS